jgi:hypothetical protein
LNGPHEKLVPAADFTVVEHVVGGQDFEGVVDSDALS